MCVWVLRSFGTGKHHGVSTWYSVDTNELRDAFKKT
jgi:hypothetical protein